MSGDQQNAAYLESGEGPGGPRLDLIRWVLAQGATWAQPPPVTLENVLAEVAQPPAPHREAPPAPRWPYVAAVVGVAAAVVALVLSTVTVVSSRTDLVVPVTGTELAPEAAGAAVLRPSGSGWWIRLEVSGLSPAPPGTYYQGWVWNQAGHGVSVGTFHQRGGDEPVILWAGVDLEDYRRISVTLEPEDGDPRPSGEVVLAGEWDEG